MCVYIYIYIRIYALLGRPHSACKHESMGASRKF